MRDLAIESLIARGFRNFDAVEVELGSRFNVLFGDNGQGKTNFLEAIYLAATTRSFRTAKLGDLVEHGADVANVRVRVREDGAEREQSVGVGRGSRDVRVDGKRSRTLASYAVLTPVVVFHPGSIALSAGAGAERRRLLDRLALHREPSSLGHADAYVSAVRKRQGVLDARGEGARDLEHWEELVVRHGLAVVRTREAAVVELRRAACGAFERIGPPGLQFGMRYAPSAPLEPDAFRTALAARRAQDRARRSASVGPHRDDLLLELDGRATRGFASQGQHRAIVLALGLAEIELITASRGSRPILLLDDVSSELDRDRTASLLDALRRQPGQVVLTTTRPGLIKGASPFPVKERRDFRVVAGKIERT